jgi:type I restriction enzyme M protein
LFLDVEDYEVDPVKNIKKERQNILDYVEREVKPHVSEFWYRSQQKQDRV